MSTQDSKVGLLGRWLEKLASKPGDYKKRYGDKGGSNSVDFRRHQRDLHQGKVPEKFQKLASAIPGNSVVDVGAGEGILCLALAATKDRVCAIDVTPKRHESGLALRQKWQQIGRDVEKVEMVLGDALSNPDLIAGFDTLVASRVVYYFGDRIDSFMEAASERVRFVCLVGNASRNRRYARGKIPADIGENVVYSTPEGMRSLLERHGFEVISTEDFGDPVVIGQNSRTFSAH